jgi:hypothetical protein
MQLIFDFCPCKLEKNGTRHAASVKGLALRVQRLAYFKQGPQDCKTARPQDRKTATEGSKT